MVITVVDERIEKGPWWRVPRYAGPVGYLMSTNPVTMRDVGTMVHSVIVRLAGVKMTRLNIVDHGNEKGFEVGDDVVTAENIGRYSAKLAQLRGRFAPHGFVHLQHCKVGNNDLLLTMLATLFGVRVYGGTGYDNALWNINSGDYVVCDRTGDCQRSFFRP